MGGAIHAQGEGDDQREEESGAHQDQGVGQALGNHGRYVLVGLKGLPPIAGYDVSQPVQVLHIHRSIKAIGRFQAFDIGGGQVGIGDIDGHGIAGGLHQKEGHQRDPE